MRLFALDGTVPLGRLVAAEMGCELDAIEEREFPEGEHKSRPLVSVRNEDVYVVHSLYGGDGQSPDDRLVRLLFFLATCRDNGAARVTAVVPYLAFMRKEVQTNPRDPISSRYVAVLLESVGTDVVVGLEVHNKAAFQNAFRCRTMHLEATQLLAERLRALVGSEPVVFLSPDMGGVKRASQMREAFEALSGEPAGMAIMEKHRSNGVLSGDLFAGEVQGRDVVIVDDMIATGGTLLRAANASRTRGATRIFAVATHALTQHWSPGLLGSSVFERIVVTDSVPASAMTAAIVDRVDVVSCASLLARAIKRLLILGLEALPADEGETSMGESQPLRRAPGGLAYDTEAGPE